MNPEERQEVEEHPRLPRRLAAGRMTTQYVAVPKTAAVAEAVQALRDFDGDIETITEIYLVDEKETLQGIVPLARLVFAKPETRLDVLAEPRFQSCNIHAHERQVAEPLDKYNLRALPVLDDDGKLVGVVEADHVIAFLRSSQ